MSRRSRSADPRAGPPYPSLMVLSALVLPSELYTPIAREDWMVALVRMTLLVGASVVAVRQWALEQGDVVALRLRRWLLLSLPTIGWYVVARHPLYLILGFTFLVGAALDMWVARAHLASEQMRIALEGRQRDRH